MKLEWKDTRTHSIAETDKYTVMVVSIGGSSSWAVYDRDSCVKHSVNPHASEAKAAAEAWLESQDQPEWTQPSPLMAFAVWRGWSLCVRANMFHKSTFEAFAVHPLVTGNFWICESAPITAAKQAITDWVRKQEAQ